MKQMLMGLVVTLAGVSAWADDFVAARAEDAAQKVELFPQATDAVSIQKSLGGATLTIESFTSWCGIAKVSAEVRTLANAHALYDAMLKESSRGIPGEVKAARNLILNVENGVLGCRVESSQKFSFTVSGSTLVGESKAFVSSQGTGSQCDAIIKNFK